MYQWKTGPTNYSSRLRKPRQFRHKKVYILGVGQAGINRIHTLEVNSDSNLQQTSWKTRGELLLILKDKILTVEQAG